jgi:hypothetical protein
MADSQMADSQMADIDAAGEVCTAMLTAGASAIMSSLAGLAEGSILLTEGQHRTLCESCRMPDCLKPPDGAW